MLENFRDTRPFALDWKRVVKQCRICYLHTPFAPRFPNLIHRKGAIWCLASLVNGSRTVILEKKVAMGPILENLSSCTSTKPLAAIAAKGPGNVPTPPMVKGFNRPELAEP